MKFFKIVVAFFLMLSFDCSTVDAEIITIFHTNDLHAHVKTDDQSIGLAEINALIKSEKSKSNFILWVDAGDTFHGVDFINSSNGEIMLQLLNESELDLFTPGNHDFNFGSEQLEKLSAKSNFEFISANIVRKNTNEKLFKPYKIYKTNEGTTIGIFGLTTPETKYKAAPNQVEAVDFLNPIDTARKMVNILRPDCDVVIGLIHMGIARDSEFTSDRIASEVNGIDLIVDAHSHTTLDEGLLIGDTLIVQAGVYGENLGRVEIELENHEIISETVELLSLIDVQRLTSSPDQKIQQLIVELESNTKNSLDVEIGQSDHQFVNDELIMKTNETELGDLCADAFRWKTGADFAIINAGGIRSELPAGKITYRDVENVFQFNNKVQLVKISGKIIRKMLNYSVATYPKPFNGFLQVSGIEFSFDARKNIGEQISDIFINGKKLSDSKIYTMATCDFLLEGGDGYDMLTSCKIVEEFDSCSEILCDYIKTVGVNRVELGRIHLINSYDEAA